MQDRLDATRAETAAARDVTEKAKRALESLGSIEVPDLDRPGDSGAGKGRGEVTPGKAAATGGPPDMDGAKYEEQERADWAGLDAECL